MGLLRRLLIGILAGLGCLGGIQQSQTAGPVDQRTVEEMTKETINLEEYLYDRVKPIITGWEEEGIYAISFLAHTNEAFDNIPQFFISYNTEEDCEGSGPLSEERWNYAYWRQDEESIIESDETTELLLRWFEQEGVKDVGLEADDEQFDENGDYIGKGPNGYYELLQVLSKVARRLHEEGIIRDTFQIDIPIIIHDLEYSWYEIEATEKANPNGIADVFLEADRQLYPE